MIYDELVSGPSLPPNDPHEHVLRQRTGLAWCRTSKQFLPHGRKLLYEHLDSRACQSPTSSSRHYRHTFAERVEHLVQYPDLAELVGTCTLELHRDTSMESASYILPLFGCASSFCLPSAQLIRFRTCARSLEVFRLLSGFPKEEHDGDHEAFEELCYQHDALQSEVFASLVPDSLRRLSIASGGPRGWGQWETFSPFLGRFEILKGLELSEMYLSGGERADPITLPVLAKLALDDCDDTLLPTLLAAAPNVATLTFCTTEHTVPSLTTLCPFFVALTINVVPVDAAADASEQVLDLATPLTFFPAVKTLALSLRTLAPASDVACAALLDSLPTTLIDCTLGGLGPGLTAAALAFRPSNYPNLASYTPWCIGSSINAWEAAHESCKRAGATCGGMLQLCEIRERFEEGMIEVMDQAKDLIVKQAEDQKLVMRWFEAANARQLASMERLDEWRDEERKDRAEEAESRKSWLATRAGADAS